MLLLLMSADFSLDFSKNCSVISYHQNGLASQNFARIAIHVYGLYTYKLNPICSAMALKVRKGLDKSMCKNVQNLEKRLKSQNCVM